MENNRSLVIFLYAIIKQERHLEYKTKILYYNNYIVTYRYVISIGYCII